LEQAPGRFLLLGGEANATIGQVRMVKSKTGQIERKRVGRGYPCLGKPRRGRGASTIQARWGRRKTETPGMI
jgi:hypothetical protein